MKVFVGAANSLQIQEASEWLPKPEYKTPLSELQDWALGKEAVWGKCYIFVEVSLPEGPRNEGKRGQIDLLLLFDDRGAHCEIKSSKSIGGVAIQSLDKNVEQINGQRKRLGGLIQGGLRQDCSQAVPSYLW